MKNRSVRIILICLLTALLLVLAACGRDILPPKDLSEGSSEPMPTPTPTPPPAPFTGTVDAVEINQALSFAQDAESGVRSPMSELVSRRSTAVFVRLSEALGHAPDDRDYLELYRGSELLGAWQPCELSSEDSLCFLFTGEDASALTSGEYTAHAVVDGVSASRGFTLTDTRALRVLTVPIRGNFGEITYPAEGWQDSFRLLKASFPIADDGLLAVRAPGMDLSAESYDLRTQSGLLNAWEALRERVGMLGEYDLVVGFVNGAMGETGACDVFGRDGILLFNAAQSAPQAVLCHYAAQSLGAGDEYEGGLLRLAANPAPYAVAGTDAVTRESAVSRAKGVEKASSAGLACAGSLVSAGLVPFDLPAQRLLEDAACFMGGTGETDDRYWISSDVWHTLFSALTAPEPDVSLTLPVGSTHRLRIAGLVDPEGGFVLQGSVTEPLDTPAATPLRDSGSYVLLVLGEQEKVLYRIYFEPDTLCPTDPPTESAAVPFDLRFPMPEGAREIRILRSADENSEDAAPMYTCPVSAAAPVSSFTALPEPEALRGTALVAWSTELPETETEDEAEAEDAPAKTEPFYELYMCFDGVKLLVWRGTRCTAELDMPSLPKPEQFRFLLLTSDGSASTVTESEVLTVPVS